MVENKLLVRAARRLRQAWCQAAEQVSQQLDYAVDRIEQRHLSFQHACRRLDKVQPCHFATFLPGLNNQILTQLNQLREAGDVVQGLLEQSAVTVPHLRTWVEELRQIDNDIGGLEIDFPKKCVSAVTEPITLKDISLGPFAIRFFWGRLKQSADILCFDIVALDPFPAENDDHVTHPHVKKEKLCAGDATMPIKLALQQGRLADAFSLIRSVLLTYNAHSPHVALEDWEGSGIDCHDCGCSMDSDDSHYCEGCSDDYCGECIGSCEVCHDTRCVACLTRCAVCEDLCCGGCLHQIEGSGRNICSNCRCICTTCNCEFTEDEEQKGSSLCFACRATNPVPAVPFAPIPVSVPTPTSPFQESLDDASLECCAAAPV